MRRVLIHIGLFLSMTAGLLAWMTTISRVTWVRFFDKVLFMLGFDNLWPLSPQARVLSFFSVK